MAISNTPAKSSRLISDLGLKKHPEGGYYLETDRQKNEVPSPFAEKEPRSLATSIYYMLSHDEPEGYLHMNKSVTYHTLHQGRALYTLITPGSPPTVTQAVIGPNASAGETRLLIVGTGVWKRSQLLPEDVQGANTDEEKDTVNCLITEVVVPGFDWHDHKYLTREGLEELFGEDKESIEKYAPYLKPANQ